jgi:autophagy-related protein 17
MTKPKWLLASFCIEAVLMFEKEWDTLRGQHMDTLDAVLESLSSQVVPNDFHSTSEGSSLFGSPRSDDERKDSPKFVSEHSPTATVRTSRLPTSTPVDRSRWKTLRDFVDERAIEDALEAIESHRGSLDVGVQPYVINLCVEVRIICFYQDALAITADYSETLAATIITIEESLPEVAPLPPIDGVLSTQVKVSNDMASHLESLAAHYDQMAGALRESEAGEEFTENDLQGKCSLPPQLNQYP